MLIQWPTVKNGKKQTLAVLDYIQLAVISGILSIYKLNNKRFFYWPKDWLFKSLPSYFLSLSLHSQEKNGAGSKQIIIREANKIIFCVWRFHPVFFIKVSIIYHYWQEKKLPLRPTRDEKSLIQGLLLLPLQRSEKDLTSPQFSHKCLGLTTVWIAPY